MANFTRGKGDYMGVAGSANDGWDYTSPVRSFWPNDFGLYDMAHQRIVSRCIPDFIFPGYGGIQSLPG